MKKIVVIDRQTGKKEEEKIYGLWALNLLYGKGLMSRLIGRPLLQMVSRHPIFSALYGYWQRLPFTRLKIRGFIKRYQIDSAEFEKPVDQFQSFNDFFIRKLKTKSRQIESSDAIIPADGRYLFFSNLQNRSKLLIKSKYFDLEELLSNAPLAKEYQNGTLILGRLAPVDCHRFHFPISGNPSPTKTINGSLYSVNPLTINETFSRLYENKRTLCTIESKKFGKVLMMEIGATNVGSIIQTYAENVPCKKGDEKGYFSFGASALIIIFKNNTLTLENDLLKFSKHPNEIYCKLGQRLGCVETG